MKLWSTAVLSLLLGCAAESTPRPDDQEPAPDAGGGGRGGGGRAGSTAGSSGSAGTAGSGGSAGTAGSAGSGGNAGSSGTAGRGGSSGAGGSAGIGGSGGGAMVDGGADTRPAGDAGGADTGPASDATQAAGTYKCSMLIGPNVHGDWFDAGFQAKVGDARWQRKTPHRSFVDDWAMTAGPWNEGNCTGPWSGCATVSRCANNAPVDRIVFVTQTGDYTTRTKENWIKVINSAIATIKTKQPMVKHIVLMTFVRGPNGGSCGGESVIRPDLDGAHVELAAKSNGEISVGPKLMVSSCSQFSGVPYVTGAGNRELADQAAAFFTKLDGAP